MTTPRPWPSLLLASLFACVHTSPGQEESSSEREPEALTRSFVPPRVQARHGLIIAVGQYRTSALRTLSGPARDKVLIRDIFQRAGVPDHAITIVSESAATLDRIRRELDGLARATKPGDRVFVYFAGHGLRVPGSTEVDRCDEALLPHDFDPARPRQTALLDDEINGWLGRMKEVEVVMIVDSCHSATVYRGVEARLSSDLIARSPGLDTKCVTAAQGDAPKLGKNTVFVAAARDDEQAYEIKLAPEESHGVFTYSLARAIGSGARSLTAAMTHASAQIRGPCRLPQHPHLSGDGRLANLSMFKPSTRLQRLPPICQASGLRLLVPEWLRRAFGRGATRGGVSLVEGGEPYDAHLSVTPGELRVVDAVGLPIHTQKVDSERIDHADFERLVGSMSALNSLYALQGKNDEAPLITVTELSREGRCTNLVRPTRTAALSFGEGFCFRVEARSSGYLNVLDFAPDGSVNDLLADRAKPVRITSGQVFDIGPLEAVPPEGADLVVVAVTAEPIALDSGEDRAAWAKSIRIALEPIGSTVSTLPLTILAP